MLLDISAYLKPIYHPESKHIDNTVCGELDPLTLMERNPSFGIPGDKLGLIVDPNPSSNDNWQNDIPAIIKTINSEIQLNSAYDYDDIKKLIDKRHSAFNTNYNLIIKKLIAEKVLEHNPLDSNMYYISGSTPF